MIILLLALLFDIMPRLSSSEALSLNITIMERLIFVE